MDFKANIETRESVEAKAKVPQRFSLALLHLSWYTA